MYIYTIISTLFIILMMLLIVPMVLASLKGAPWVPSNKYGIEVMLHEAQLKPGMLVMDPGCGDGRLLFRALKKEPGIKGIGYELFFIPYVLAKIHSWFHPNITILFRDSRKVDMSNVDVLMCYMLPESLKHLGLIWKKKLPSQAKVISYAFLIDGWKSHKRIEKVPHLNQAPINIYLIKDQI